MNRQQIVLSRLGEDKLANLLGREMIDVLSSLSDDYIGPKRLSDLLIDLEGPNLFLVRKDVRKSVFDSLARADATELAKKLGQPGVAPWSELSEVNFRKGSAACETLLSWLGIEEWDLPNESHTVPEISKVKPVSPQYPLFPHQIDAVSRVRQVFSNGDDRVILHMPTGSGKTRSAMNVIVDQFRGDLKNGRSVVWLAHSEELCEQAAQEFERAWQLLGNRQIDVIRHFGSHAAENLGPTSNAFVVISLQSAHALAFSSVNDGSLFSLGRKAGLVVIDEAHKATASTYEHVLDLLAPRGSCRLLGLTATPGRSWLEIDADEKLAEFFDRKKVTLEIEGFANPVDYLVANGYLAKVETESIKYDGGVNLSESEIEQLSSSGEVPRNALKRISNDTARNLRILLRTEKEAREGNSVILFACSVEHSKMLSALLKLRGVDAACVTGDTPRDSRRRAIEKFKDGRVSVLCNYGVLSTGFDAPKANVALIARPTQSLVLYSQMVGRVIRGTLAGGTEECKVITVVDQKYGFRNLGEAFTFWDELWEEQ